MTAKEPTQTQIREFWEWCGFRRFSYKKSICSHTPRCKGWKDPGGIVCFKLPLLDLNNLFKYAVPLAIDRIMAEQGCSSDLAYAILFKKWLQKLECDIPNHEETLFWAIWEVIKK